MGQLMVGTSRRNITPPVGAWLAGYGSRDHGAEGVRDELLARVTVLGDGATEAATICRDVLDVEDHEMAMLAVRLEEPTGLTHEQVFVANTHTHSGPTTHLPKMRRTASEGVLVEQSVKALERVKGMVR